VEPCRRARQPAATVRFEIAPEEQAQIDWGSFRYQTAEGSERWICYFVLVLSWSRTIYTTFVPKAEVATFQVERAPRVAVMNRATGRPARRAGD
jgi:hypothetical protein